MESELTDEEIQKLNSFSKRHYTYINQIFGDLSVREIISELFPSDNYTLFTKEYESTHHHVVKYKKTKKIWCSFNKGYQHYTCDTLCQSYSLLKYFQPTESEEVFKDPKKRQMEMIKMYRKLLASSKFIKALDEVIQPRAKEIWTNYTYEPIKPLKMNKNNIIKGIKKVLSEWKQYGWKHFLRNDCQDHWGDS